MKRLIASLHVTRWLRVVAIAGVMLGTAAVVDQDQAEAAYRATSFSAWCSRC